MSKKSLNERNPAFAEAGKMLQKHSPKEEENQDSLLNNASGLIPLRIKRMSDVTSQAVQWLWKPFIAYGAFTLIDGEEGIGKSLLMLAIGCAVARGEGFDTIEGFSFYEAEKGNVLLLSAEESLSFMVKPRLLALKAPLEQFVAVVEPFTLDRDGCLRLEMAIAENKAKAVIIDPLFSYTGKIKLNDDAEIRSVTGELIRIAEKFGCAILGVRHLNKSKGFGDSRNAGLNGVGWRASPRSALLVGKDRETGELAICQTKNNLAPKSDKSFGFRIESTPVTLDSGETVEIGKFHWTGESKLTEQKMLANAPNEIERGETLEAVEFLRDALSVGERLAIEVEKEADELYGLSKKQLRTASSKIRVHRRRKGFGKDSKIYWRLPDIDAQMSPESAIDVSNSEGGNL